MQIEFISFLGEMFHATSSKVHHAAPASQLEVETSSHSLENMRSKSGASIHAYVAKCAKH
jgi:hypothetical protein